MFIFWLLCAERAEGSQGIISEDDGGGGGSRSAGEAGRAEGSRGIVRWLQMLRPGNKAAATDTELANPVADSQPPPYTGERTGSYGGCDGGGYGSPPNPNTKLLHHSGGDEDCGRLRGGGTAHYGYGFFVGGYAGALPAHWLRASAAAASTANGQSGSQVVLVRLGAAAASESGQCGRSQPHSGGQSGNLPHPSTRSDWLSTSPAAAASAATLRALRTILSVKLPSPILVAAPSTSSSSSSQLTLPQPHRHGGPSPAKPSNSIATADSSSPSRAEGDSPGITRASPTRPIASPVALASATGDPAPASPSPSSSSADPIPNQNPIFCLPPVPSPTNVNGSPGDFELLAAWRIQHPSLWQQFDAARRNLSYELAALRDRGFSQLKLTLATQLGPAAAAAAAALPGALRSNSANEVWAWHGVPVSALPSLLAHGFLERGGQSGERVGVWLATLPSTEPRSQLQSKSPPESGEIGRFDPPGVYFAEFAADADVHAMAEAGAAADETGNGAVSKSGCQPKSGGESGGQSGADDAVEAGAAKSGRVSTQDGSQPLQPMQAGAVQAVTAALWPGGSQPDQVRYLVLARLALGATVRVQSPGGGLNSLSDSDGVSGSELDRNGPIHWPGVGRRALARVPLEAAPRTLGLSSVSESPVELRYHSLLTEPPQQPPSDVARTTSAEPATNVAAGMQATAGGRDGRSFLHARQSVVAPDASTATAARTAGSHDWRRRYGNSSFGNS
ncbi:hypothetical protein T492DRAFT_1132038 [Pavlovales sp. CCMP2436]|nr:hypothetical protein T492DRAFT_1132038 [Pavlovales sp. CCMP2436]